LSLRPKHILCLTACLLLALGIGTFAPTTAKAELLDFGDLIEGNSWAQPFNESGVGNFDTIEVFMISDGDFFEAPGFYNFNNGSWSIEDPFTDVATYVKATGSDVTSLKFNIKFYGSKSNPLTFDFLAWNDGTLLEAARANWNGRWSFSAAPAENYVPEPATMLLLGTGLIGLAASGRKKFRKL